MAAFDPERILRALSKREVQYILVGASAARLQSFPRVTADADITQDQQDVIIIREMLKRR